MKIICLHIRFDTLDFPKLWPSPKAHTGRFITGGDGDTTALILPVLSPQDPPLPAPDLQPPLPFKPHVSGMGEPQVFSATRDHIAGTASVRIGTSGRTRVNERVSLNRRADATATVWEHNPARATIRGVNQVQLEWPDRVIDTTARAQIESTAQVFNVTIQLDITVDGQPYHQRHWTKSIPRHLL